MLQNSVSKNCQMPELGCPVQPEELELCPPPCLVQLSVCVGYAWTKLCWQAPVSSKCFPVFLTREFLPLLAGSCPRFPNQLPFLVSYQIFTQLLDPSILLWEITDSFQSVWILVSSSSVLSSLPSKYFDLHHISHQNLIRKWFMERCVRLVPVCILEIPWMEASLQPL